MTTLTADVPRSLNHCPHKLPSSCRLTSLPTCCACQDRRPHSSSYSKYIDGVGFVLRGTRQERYCWMCKEFWNARIAASGIAQSDTRIPERPDQSSFLEKWYDWHRGYGVIKHDNGREVYQALRGENLADVAPGFLPRTLAELRAGVRGETLVNPEPETGSLDLHHLPSEILDIDPEDRIFDLEPAPIDIAQPSGISTSLVTRPSTPTYPTPISSTSSSHVSDTQTTTARSEDGLDPVQHQFRRVAALRREVQRLRAGVERVMSGLQELGEIVPDSQDALQHTTTLTNHLGNMEAHLSNPGNRSSDTMEHARNSDSMDWTIDGPASANNQAQVAGGAHEQSGNTDIARGVTHSYQSQTFSSRYSIPTYNGQAPHNSPIFHEQQIQAARTRLDVARAQERTQEQYHRHPQAMSNGNQDQVQAQMRHAIHYRELCERELANLDPAQRQNTLLFGNREEIERQGNNYEGPISDLFNTYSNRYGVAEEQRRHQRTVPNRYPDTVASYMQPSTRSPTGPDSEHVRSLGQVREQRLRSRRLLPAGPHQPVQSLTRPQPAGTTHAPYLTSMIRNQAASGQQHAALMREQLATAEAMALAHSRQGPAGASGTPPSLQRDTHAHTRSGDGSNPYGFPAGLHSPYRARRTENSPSMPPTYSATSAQYDSVGATGIHGRAAALRQRVLLRREDLGAPGAGFDDSDGDEPSRSEIERYIVTGSFRRREPEPLKSLDKDDGRPEPISEEEMMVKMECKVCFGQIATVALLPCGHCVLCKWCADEAVPSHKLDQTAPASRRAQCPVCRKKVKQKATIYGGEAKEPKPKEPKESKESKDSSSTT